MGAGMSATSPFPKLTRKERSALNQLLWAKRILREAPVERLRLAERIEQFSREHGLPERSHPTAQTDGGPDQHWADGLGLPDE